MHARLIVYICDQLQDQLGGQLRARVEERLVVESDDVAVRSINRDARVFESPMTIPRGGVVALADPVVEPLIVPLPNEDATETFIEIVERGKHDRLVTVIELLSPGNKIGFDARRAYAAKRKEVRMAGANLVEIDLTRAGHRQLAVWPIPKSHRTTFNDCVTRAHDRSARAAITKFFTSLRRPMVDARPDCRFLIRRVGDA